METLNTILESIDNVLWGNWMLIALLGIGVLYTIVTGGVQFKYFGYAIKKTVIEPFKPKKTTSESGGISSFQALCTALASCVGSGNIVGVSTAVLAGGLGALFWMWVAALVGMATKYGEIVLGILYRVKDEKGNFRGGPMYYIEKGLHCKWLACICAFAMVLQIIGGNFIQSNTISGVMLSNFAIPAAVTGVILCVLIFIISAGGLKKLSEVATKLVPVMSLIYIVAGIFVIVYHYRMIPAVLHDIFAGAFGLRPILGGAAGSAMIAAQRGIQRGLYSNEAGEGSAPVIHSSALVSHPSEQGIYGITEVFLDTFVLCSITGLVLGVTGVQDSGLAANVLIIESFAKVSVILKYFVLTALCLFCFTTLMSQWYFGFVGLQYLFGEKPASRFKYIFPVFCIIGAMLKIDMVWTIQDIALAFLTIPNIIALLFLFPQVRKAHKEYAALLQAQK
jgi:AGCS family alanine or glycine:cation symporter